MWQRYNQTTHIFEKSINNGASWTPMPIAASGIEGTLGKANLPATIAYEDEGNIFTVDQKIRTGYYPSLVLENNGLAVDSRNWWIRNDQSGNLTFQAINDANSNIIAQPLYLGRDNIAYATHLIVAGNTVLTGNVTVQGATQINKGMLRVEGARGAGAGAVGPGIEMFFQSGVAYIHPYDATTGTYPPLSLYGSSVSTGPLNVNGALTGTGDFKSTGVYFPGRVDVAGQQSSWYLASHGSHGLWSNTGLYLSGGLWVASNIYGQSWIYERARGLPIGYSESLGITVWANGGGVSGATGQVIVSRVGQTMLVNFTIQNIYVGASVSEIYISWGTASAGLGRYIGVPVLYHDGGANWSFVMGYSNPGETFIRVSRPSANFNPGVGNQQLMGIMIVPIG